MKGRAVLFRVLAVAMVLVVSEGLMFVYLSLYGERLHLPDLAGARPTVQELDRAREIFDAELGWTIPYETAFGERPRRYDRGGPVIAACGDSFTHGDEVAHLETWAEYLAEILSADVLNFGAGGYGMDQALLRCEREVERLQQSGRSVEHAMLAFISWDIERNVSVYWKFREPASGLALVKPRFVLEDPLGDLDGDGLELVPNPLSSPRDLDRLRDLDFLRGLQRWDFWANRYDLPPAGFPHLTFLFRGGFWRAVDERRKPIDYWNVQPTRQLAERILLRFQRSMIVRGVTPHVLHLPVFWEAMSLVDHGERPASVGTLRRLCAENDLDCATGLETFRHLDRSTVPDFYTKGQDGGHFTPMANSRMAGFVARSLALRVSGKAESPPEEDAEI